MCGGSVLRQARWGSQPALRLSAPLSPAVRRRDVEGLIALIDTFPSHPTLGRPSLIPPFILLPLPRWKRGAVQSSSLPSWPWNQGWGRSGEAKGCTSLCSGARLASLARQFCVS